MLEKNELQKIAIHQLKNRGVELEDIGEIKILQDYYKLLQNISELKL